MIKQISVSKRQKNLTGKRGNRAVSSAGPARGDRERVEGKDRKDGRAARKQHPRWFCEERQMVSVPLAWNKFPGFGVPVGGSRVFVAVRGYGQKVLEIPYHFLYEQTAQLFKEQHVQWWTYMPPIPMGEFKESRVLSAGDFFYNAWWDAGL